LRRVAADADCMGKWTSAVAAAAAADKDEDDE